VTARASDLMFLFIDFVRVTNCFYDYDYDSGRLAHKVIIHPASSQAQDRESSPVKDQRSTTVLRQQLLTHTPEPIKVKFCQI